MMFRKRPVIIEAKKFTNHTAFEVAHWCGGRVDQYIKPSDHTDVYLTLSIPTLEGTMIASHGDWIIRGVEGEFYPCKPDIFEKTYEEVK
jgi:hypothetical protein